jgi:DNA (cytosine-5)-methyltransferase 1
VNLVLSLFPGIGLLDRAFEEEGFCVVRGPDLLWGGDIRAFHPPAGRFDGVIGGPPCQVFSGLNNLMRAKGITNVDLIPEYERVVAAVAPEWFLMENVRQAPLPVVPGFKVRAVLINNRWLGEEQSRVRRFSFGTRDGRALAVSGFAALDSQRFAQTVTACHAGERRVHGKKATGGKIARYTVDEALRLQGCPPDFFGPRSPLKRDAQLKVLAQGVPLPMGRAIARAVKAATSGQQEATA